MYIAQIVIMTVIMSYLSLSSSYLTSSAIDIVKSQKQTQDMTVVGEAAVSFYDQTGNLPSSFSDVGSYLNYVSNSGWKDADGAEFQFLTNGGSDFAFNGISTYKVAVVAPGIDGLDSSIVSNSLILSNNEEVYLLTAQELDKGFRGKTKSNLTFCNSASTLYQSDNGGAFPATVNVLTSNSFLNPFYAVDGMGQLLKVTAAGVCYSVGYDGVDNSGSGDDIL